MNHGQSSRSASGKEPDCGFNSLKHACRVSKVLPCDVKGGSMVWRSSNKGKAGCEVHSVIAGEHFEWNKALVMIQGKSHVEMFVGLVAKIGIRWERPLDNRSFKLFPEMIQCGLHHPYLFIPNQSTVSGVRV